MPTTSSGTGCLPKMAQLDISKHAAFIRRCLNLLPPSAAHLDLNRMSLGFFLLNSLDILNKLDTETSAEERSQWIDWIYSCQLHTGGFRGSTATKTSEASIYDTVHLPAAYFSIATLLILGDDLKRVNRKGMLHQLKKLQNEDGSFSPVLLGEERYGEVDVRHVYCAIAVREMLSPICDEEDFDVIAAINYIQQCKVPFLLRDYLR